MNLLDENVRDDQRALLRKWRIPFRQIGKEISRAGLQDDNVLPLLHQLRRPTLFTQDGDFFKRQLCHRGYCLVWLNVSNIEAAFFIRCFLRHRAFRTQGPRLGKVVRVHPHGVSYFEAGQRELVKVEWEDE